MAEVPTAAPLTSFESPMLAIGTGPTFSNESGASAPGHPGLVGGRCACGHTFIPMQNYGCEVCGRASEDLKPVLLGGRGRLKSFAEVRRHQFAFPATPFTLVVIELDDGPIVRALLESPTDPDLVIGDVMVTTVVSAPDLGGGESKQVRFRRLVEGV